MNGDVVDGLNADGKRGGAPCWVTTPSCVKRAATQSVRTQIAGSDALQGDETAANPASVYRYKVIHVSLWSRGRVHAAAVT